jgi:hypothetical protein
MVFELEKNREGLIGEEEETVASLGLGGGSVMEDLVDLRG